MIRKYLLLLILFCSVIQSGWATHNRAGEITFTRLSGLTYKFTVITYSDPNSQADRCEIEVFWGDGSSDTLTRINSDPSISGCQCMPKCGERLSSNIKRNIYEGVHTFPGADIYTVSIEDPNRVGGVINIPNSVNIPFYIQTKLTISPFLGLNSSPQLLNPPIDNACTCKKFIHNPGAWDVDGDSLSYELVNCKGEDGLDIPGYFIPSGVSINPLTGDLVWNCPTPAGEFNFAILIKEWRNTKVISSILRDMQITVSGNCINNPPVIAALDDICVEANQAVSFEVNATDADFQNINLTSTGGPFIVSNPAQFSITSSGPGTKTGAFYWLTKCLNVRLQPYQVSFRAEDIPNSTAIQSLVDYKTVNITVVGPAPQNLTATPIGNSIKLNWSASSCSEAVGYRIYRRNGPYGFVHAQCETGIPAYTGYNFIAEIQGLNNTTYTDNNGGAGLIHGNDYCYMIYAVYPDKAKSYASSEVCTQLKKDVPIITNVSIENTDPVNGKVYVAWSKPTEIDPVQIPGPFKYFIYRSSGISGTNFVLIDSLSGINDTIYNDDHVLPFNTQDNAYSYRIDFYNDAPGNRFFVGSTQKAASIFINITPADNQLTLSWTPNVPWTNNEYLIYKKNDVTGLFSLIGATASTSFTDIGLINGKEYCYYIESRGSYSASGIINPIINLSQIKCERPKDLTPPCAPALTVIPDCNLIENSLTWNNPNNSCSDDAVTYKIYYRPVEDSTVIMNVIATIMNSNDTTFLFDGANFNNSIAGCYSVTAIDSFGNESVKSKAICVDNCPVYELPNVFSPNGDGKNDFFIPFPYKFVQSIDLKIFNRWGQVVFETTDPNINWDGVNKDTKRMSSDGVYFYVCIVNEIRLKGIVPRNLTGFFHLFSTSSPQAN